MVTVFFSNETDFDTSDYEQTLKEVINESLNSCTAATSAPEVSVSFLDNRSIRQLNKKYRHIDSSTDVLSFPMYDTWREWPNAGQAVNIGDIVISVEKAAEQSEAYGHSLARELGFLTAHSMLHLMGYDHISPESEEEMCALQDEILIKAGLPR